MICSGSRTVYSPGDYVRQDLCHTDPTFAKRDLDRAYYTSIQGSPSGCGRREIPGVSQVEKITQEKKPCSSHCGRKECWGNILQNRREVVSRNTYRSLAIPNFSSVPPCELGHVLREVLLCVWFLRQTHGRSARIVLCHVDVQEAFRQVLVLSLIHI